MKKILYFGQDYRDFETLRLGLYHKFQFFHGNDPERLISQIDCHAPSIVLFDPSGSGEKFLVLLRAVISHPLKPALILTGKSLSGDMMASALKAGILDIMPAPIDSGQFLAKITNYLLLGETEMDLLQGIPSRAQCLIGETPAIIALKGKIAQLARTKEPLLISGESGTGRALLARVIHDCGEGSSRPFLRVTGGSPMIFSSGDVPSLLECVGSGTLFIENLEELGLEAQYLLLRLLEDGVFTSRKWGTSHPFSGRVIGSTAFSLAELVAKGAFRRELLLRLETWAVQLPPLRNRKSDVPLIAAAFLKKKGYGGSLSPESLNYLMAYSWPGNIRELEKILSRAIHLAGSSPVIPPELVNC